MVELGHDALGVIIDRELWKPPHLDQTCGVEAPIQTGIGQRVAEISQSKGRTEMNNRFGLHINLSVVLGTVLTLACLSGVSQAQPIGQGWDLLQTTQGTGVTVGTSFIPFQGVALGMFDFTKGDAGDFGRGIGVQNTGSTTDTILKRLQPASDANPVIDIELVGLQLVSQNPVDFGAGMDFHYVTLQSDRLPPENPGPLSRGLMTLSFTDQTLDFAIFEYLDVRKGAPNGPIVISVTDLLMAKGSPWTRSPQPDAFLLPGVNQFLAGPDDTSQDGYLASPCATPTVATGTFVVHAVCPATQ